MLYAAITILWFVALPGFQFISSVSGIVNVMSLVLPAIACLFILGSRLCGLVVRVSGYRYRGPGFDPRHYQIF